MGRGDRIPRFHGDDLMVDPPRQFYAHSANAEGQWHDHGWSVPGATRSATTALRQPREGHDLADHLRSVANLAGEFASKMGCGIRSEFSKTS